MMAFITFSELFAKQTLAFSCNALEAVKLETGGDREGEAPAEPHGARTCWGDGSLGGSPSQFFHTF